MSLISNQAKPTAANRHIMTSAIFGAGAILSLVVIAHHPTVSGAVGADEMAKIVDISAAARFVHGGLIVIVTAFWVAMLNLSQYLGAARTSVRTGMQLYSMGSFAMILAMLFDGFVVPDFVSAVAPGATNAVATAFIVLKFCSATIQILTKFGFIAAAVGIASYSARLFRGTGFVRLTGATGFLGVVATLVPVMLMGVRLSPHTLGLIFGVQALWYLLISIVVIKMLLPEGFCSSDEL
jgi:hypothetical protein